MCQNHADVFFVPPVPVPPVWSGSGSYTTISLSKQPNSLQHDPYDISAQLKGLESLATLPVISCLQSRHISNSAFWKATFIFQPTQRLTRTKSSFVKRKGKQTKYDTDKEINQISLETSAILNCWPRSGINSLNSSRLFRHPFAERQVLRLRKHGEARRM